MTPEQVEAAAGALFEAERSGIQTGLLSLAYPGMTMDDAERLRDRLIAGAPLDVELVDE